METGERQRLAALRRYRILDTEPEQAFDDLTLLASQICGPPMALITLLDDDRQWFKSRRGVSVTETSRSIAFCDHAIQQRRVYTVADALCDERFRENPMVAGEPRIRFYAGAPLVTPDGHALGTLCVVDRVPRTLTPEQEEALQALKRQAEAQLSGVQRLTALVPYCSACQFIMVIPADPRSIATVTDGVTELLRERGWTDAEIMGVELAVQEAVANAIRHGCGNDSSKQIQCIVTCSDTGDVTVVVRDPGAGFDTQGVADPLHPENVLKTGGRGIFLINQLMDEVGFSDGGRELQMRKR